MSDRLPRGKVIINPEDYDCSCMLPGYKCPECRHEERESAVDLAALEKERAAMAAKHARPLEPVAAWTYEQAREAAYKAEMERGSREAVGPLEPVAAVTYDQAREYAEAAEKARMEAAKYMPPKLAPAPAGVDGYYSQEAMAERAAGGLPRREAGTVLPVAEWNDVPDTTQPLRQAVFNCVKRYLFVKYGDKLIIEVELMSGTTLRHIIKVSQVKGILTKGHTRPYAEGQRPEKEVIIDLRAITCPGYAPEQLKFKLSGDENALAFQMALMDAL